MKRILSLFVACLMLVSVFAIGITSVAAAETTSWTLPMNWARDLDKDANNWELASKNNGLWRLTSFDDLDDPSTINWAASKPDYTLAPGATASGQNSLSPESYVESYNNRSYFTNVSGWADKWYVNYRQRHQKKSFEFVDNTTSINVFPGNAGYNFPAVVFTAPEAGSFNYTELVKLLISDAAVEVTVRKNGTVLTTKNATTAGETISGTVELAKGDLLMFAFELTSETTVSDSTPVINLSKVVITKGAAAGGDNTGEGGEVTPPTGGDDDEEEITVTVGQKFISDLAIGKTVSGQFFMAGYKVADGTLVPVEPDERETWDPAWPGHFVAEANTVAIFCKPEDGGAFDMNTKLDYNSAVAFKAPAKATYAIDVKVARLYALSDPDRPVNIILMKDDGTVLDKVENVQGADTEVVFDKSVALEKGEVVFVRVQFAGTEEAHKNGGFNVRLESFEVTVESVGSAGSATNPDTSDNLVLAVSALMLAAAGVVIASKKRR